jgi:hypothetical protein
MGGLRRQQLSLESDSETYCCAYLGGYLLLCGTKGGVFPRSFLLGPDRCCVPVTLGLLIAPAMFLIVLISQEAHLLWAVLLLSCTTTLSVVTYLCVALSDPGIVLKNPPVEVVVVQTSDVESGTNGGSRRSDTTTECAMCGVERQRGTVHCPRCRICVAKVRLVDGWLIGSEKRSVGVTAGGTTARCSPSLFSFSSIITVPGLASALVGTIFGCFMLLHRVCACMCLLLLCLGAHISWSM